MSSALFVLRSLTLHFAGLKHMFRGVHFAKCCSLPHRLGLFCLFTTVAYLQLFQQLIYLFFSSKSFITIMNSLGERTNHFRTSIKMPSWYLSENLDKNTSWYILYQFTHLMCAAHWVVTLFCTTIVALIVTLFCATKIIFYCYFCDQNYNDWYHLCQNLLNLMLAPLCTWFSCRFQNWHQVHWPVLPWG